MEQFDQEAKEHQKRNDKKKVDLFLRKKELVMKEVTTATLAVHSMDGFDLFRSRHWLIHLPSLFHYPSLMTIPSDHVPVYICRIYCTVLIDCLLVSNI